jgi:hypothetical protein
VLNNPSQPLWRALGHDVASAGPPGVRRGDKTRPDGSARVSHRVLSGSPHQERRGERFPRREHHSRREDRRWPKPVHKKVQRSSCPQQQRTHRGYSRARKHHAAGIGAAQIAYGFGCSSLRKYVAHQRCRSRITQVSNLLKHGDRNIAIRNIIARFDFILEYYIYCRLRKPR